MTISPALTFIGANIKGTPAMKAPAVAHDLRRVKRDAHVFGVQEFKWPWYWQAAHKLLTAGFGAYPGWTSGLGHPIDGAQAIFWRRRTFKRLATYGVPAFDFDRSSAGIMDNRYMRAALVEERTSRLACWYASTHFVVGGDSHDDGDRREEFMRDNLARLDLFLRHLRSTGHPVVMELDANIRRGTWAYDSLVRVLTHNGAEAHGERGVEYLFSIDGADVEVQAVKATTIPTSQLRTDHEARVLRHRLVTA